jgi:hypothetical protein
MTAVGVHVEDVKSCESVVGLVVDCVGLVEVTNVVD